MTYDEILGSKAQPYAVNSVPLGYIDYTHLLLEKTLGMYKYSGLPESLPDEQIESRLIMQGYCVVFKDQKAGLVTCYGGLSGIDKYYLPTRFVYAQPVMGSGTRIVGTNCVVIYNSQIDQYERMGLYQIIKRYARLLADYDSSINILTVNTRATKNNVVATKNVAKSVDEAMKKLEDGARYTINQNSILDLYKTVDFFTPKERQLEELINAKERTLAAFLAEIGVKSSSDKRERVISDEVYADDQLLTVNVDDLLKWRKKGVQQINDMFGTDITVDRSDAYKLRGGDKNGTDSSKLSGEQPDND